MSFLTVKNITKSFGSTQVLRGIDFSMEKGEVVTIIGSSGSGKTTLLRCLNFLEIADEGEIIVGEDVIFAADGVNRFNDKELREKRLRFGLVFQSFNLFPQYTALENVMLAPKLRLDERARTEKLSKGEKQEALEAILAKANDLLARVGLAEKAEHYPCQLSGGQQQRVAIARALMLDPDILCFDEPTSALDPELTGEVLRVIKELKDQGCTLLVVTHEMDFARNVADRVVFVADGLIEEEGTPEQLFTAPKSPKTAAFLQHAHHL
jgi:polar amino acid transport system ATP-binding protein